MIDIIIIAFIAAFILLRLRSELGKKTGNEPLPPAAGGRPMGSGSGYGGARQDEGAAADTGDVIDLEENPRLRHAYQDIRRADRNFDVSQFLTGAKAAHQMILEAFWAGDKETLKDFLDDSVFGQFSAAVDQRETDNLTLENKFLDLTEIDVVDAKMAGKTAEITVHFRAEIIAVTKNADGEILAGDTSDAVEVNDKWTFARNTQTKDPNWLLVATQPG